MHLQEPKQAGFTLIEILVTMTIMAILFTVGMINWNKTIQKQRVLNTREKIETALAQGFSVSRSQGKSVKIYGNKDKDYFCIDEKNFRNDAGNIIENECKSSEICEFNKKNELENSITFNADFCLVYKNAFGDISGNASTNIEFSSDKFQSSISISQKSGLITANPVTEK